MARCRQRLGACVVDTGAAVSIYLLSSDDVYRDEKLNNTIQGNVRVDAMGVFLFVSSFLS
jgi:hypothetical protein